MSDRTAFYNSPTGLAIKRKFEDSISVDVLSCQPTLLRPVSLRQSIVLLGLSLAIRTCGSTIAQSASPGFLLTARVHFPAKRVVLSRQPGCGIELRGTF